MSISFELNAEVRHDLGKGASRRLRRDDKVPAVLYGAGKEATYINLSHNEVAKRLAHEAFYSHILTLKLDGQTERAVLKDIQRHPSKPRVMHMDFQRISENEEIRMHVPLHFINADIAPGVKQGGGIVSHLMIDVEIACLPRNLPEFIEVDLKDLQVGGSVHLSDLKLPHGVEITALSHGDDRPVASIHVPRGAIEEAAAAAAPATPAAG
ncbi:MAG: 50S ribosomal protein L25/general stress protein Ctc [Gammaproteobacteria bacterium]|nr:50S ribosomal protein L25/general stress protein Ctc [Gammaproteobacteria bacterium]